MPYAVPLYDLPSNPMGYKIRDGWPANLKRVEAYRVETFAVGFNLLKAGEAAVYAPRFAIDRGKNSPYVLVKEHKKAETQKDYYLVKTKNSPETVEMKKVCKVLRKIFKT